MYQTFLSSRDMPFDDEIDAMQHFDHISTKEFFEDNPFLKIFYKTYPQNLSKPVDKCINILSK